MKIVNREQFLALPENTLFSNYEPCIFEGILIKQRSIGNDFYYTSIVDAVECSGTDSFVGNLATAEEGESIAMDFDCVRRDGCFELDQLFAIYEPNDVQGMINKFTECLQNINPYHFNHVKNKERRVGIIQISTFDLRRWVHFNACLETMIDIMAIGRVDKWIDRELGCRCYAYANKHFPVTQEGCIPPKYTLDYNETNKDLGVIDENGDELLRVYIGSRLSNHNVLGGE